MFLNLEFFFVIFLYLPLIVDSKYFKNCPDQLQLIVEMQWHSCGDIHYSHFSGFALEGTIYLEFSVTGFSWSHAA